MDPPNATRAAELRGASVEGASVRYPLRARGVRAARGAPCSMSALAWIQASAGERGVSAGEPIPIK